MNLLIYALKVAACAGILTAYYWMLLRNKKFHQYNRFYILLVFFLSLFVPFLQIPVFDNTGATNTSLITTLQTISVNEFEETATIYFAKQNSWHWLTMWNVVYAVYALGCLSFCYLFLKALVYIYRISKKYPSKAIGDIQLYQTNEPAAPFSFFKKIFWKNNLSLTDEKGSQIFRHEMYHVRHGHSFDIIVTEIIILFFWWNPFFYLLRKELKTIHEFLADQHAISHHNKFDYASLLVTQSLHSKTSSITHPFFHNALKRRIAMITKNQTPRFQYISKVLALPLLALVVTAFAIKKVNNPISHTIKDPITVVIDAGHGGNDLGSMGADTTVSEALLSLQIAKKVRELSNEYGITIIMTREGNEFPGNVATKEEGMIKRIEITHASKAAAFISIHINSTTEKATRSGFEAVTSSKREDAKDNALASVILQQLNTIYRTDTIIKQRKSMGIYVLDKSPCPAVILECGYMTNSSDLDFIKKPVNQEKIARKILEGIVKYNQFKFNESKTSGNEPALNSSNTVAAAATAPVVNRQVVTDTLDIAELKKLNVDDILKMDVGKVAITVTLRNGEIKLFRTADLKESITLRDKNKATIVSKEKITSIPYSDPAELDKINPNDIASINVDKKESKTMTIHLKNGSVLVMDADKVSIYYDQKKDKTTNVSADVVSDGEKTTITNFSLQKENTKNDTQKEQPIGDNIVFTRTDIEAEYPGGNEAWIKYLLKNLRYPEAAIRSDIQGTVVVQFIVDKEGKLSEVSVVEGPHALRAESVRIIRESGGWIPAIQNGRKVRAYKKQPITYLLQEVKKQL